MAGAPDQPPSARQDLIGGILAVALGIFAIAEAAYYPMGSLLRMGPGFFPCLIAAIIVALGIVLIVNAVRPRAAHDGEGADVRLRPVLWIGVGIALFALLLERIGLVPATAVLVVVSSLAEPRWRFRRVAAVAVGMTVLVYVVFIVVLQIPIPAVRL
jgi:hypothetical protein